MQIKRIDLFLATAVLVWMFVTIFCDLYFFNTPWEYVIRQSCVASIFIICAITTHVPHKLPLTNIPMTGISFLAITELIDELKFKNDHAKLDDYVFVCAGVIGILIGVLLFLHNYKKHNASIPR